MVTLAEGQLLWSPTPEFAAKSEMARYLAWLAETRGQRFADYNALWTWSVTDIEDFWASIWDFFDVRASQRYACVLDRRVMPGARWFEGAHLNFADQIFRHTKENDGAWAGRSAIRFASESAPVADLSWRDLEQQVRSLAASLRRLGVVEGDRVVALMPNIPETMIAFLACASIGAIWSLCSPDMGQVAVLDRFHQISPKVLIAVDGYQYGGQIYDRTENAARLAAGLPSLSHVVVLSRMSGDARKGSDTSVDFSSVHNWHDLVRDPDGSGPVQVAFNHPLWVVYSSGTTGNPKPIVHSHGGILLEFLKMSLHGLRVGDDVNCWYTTAGWIIWNAQLLGLMRGTTVAIYDGSPAHPDLGRLWRFVEEAGVTNFGAGSAFFANCMKAGLVPSSIADLTKLQAVGATGSPLPAEAYQWLYDTVRKDIWVVPISGGTDFSGAFVGGNPMLPVYSGEMQCRCLGAKVEAYDDDGNPLIGEVGELVCTEPMPSMPLFFWGDEDGSRYRDSYFDTYPGVWRHGDWIKITERGGAIIYGRSDATINRHGIRMGTAEIYRVVEDIPDVLDSLVVDLEFLGRPSWMALFIVPRSGLGVDDALRERIRTAIRTGLSARYLPNEIIEIAAVPRTLSGKKLELPVKKILLGHPPEKAVNRDAMMNPDSLDVFIKLAAERNQRS